MYSPQMMGVAPLQVGMGSVQVMFSVSVHFTGRPVSGLTPVRSARAFSSSLRNTRRPWNWPPTHFSAAAASTPSGAPPEPM